jgi:hypothetical protein
VQSATLSPTPARWRMIKDVVINIPCLSQKWFVSKLSRLWLPGAAKSGRGGQEPLPTAEKQENSFVRRPATLSIPELEQSKGPDLSDPAVRRIE